jgi:DNA-binding transcriptional MerR regulator
MRIAELSRRTGASVPTIKYYLREGLLPAGELTSRNQARYDEEHVRRLRLIRALVDVGGLSIGQVQDVLTAIDSPDENVHDVLGVVQWSIATPRARADDESWQDAQREVDELIARHGWRAAKGDSPAGQTLATVIVTLRELGHDDLLSVLDEYAKACEHLAEVELGTLGRGAKVEDLVERMVIGTVLGETALAAIRRLAHQEASARRFEN